MGNVYTEFINVPNNKISINSLKKIISDQLGFEPSYQRLTYQLYNKKIITLPNDFPLFYFNITDYSVIFLENFKNIRYKNKKTSRSPISMKYMNRLGYHFQYPKKCQSVTNLISLETKTSFVNSNFNSNKNSIALSDDEVIISKNTKEDNKNEEDEDYELVLNNDKDMDITKEDDKISSNNIIKLDKNVLETLSEKLIHLIKKKILKK